MLPISDQSLYRRQGCNYLKKSIISFQEKHFIALIKSQNDVEVFELHTDEGCNGRFVCTIDHGMKPTDTVRDIALYASSRELFVGLAFDHNVYLSKLKATQNQDGLITCHIGSYPLPSEGLIQSIQWMNFPIPTLVVIFGPRTKVCTIRVSTSTKPTTINQLNIPSHLRGRGVGECINPNMLVLCPSKENEKLIVFDDIGKNDYTASFAGLMNENTLMSEDEIGYIKSMCSSKSGEILLFGCESASSRGSSTDHCRLSEGTVNVLNFNVNSSRSSDTAKGLVYVIGSSQATEIGESAADLMDNSSIRTGRVPTSSFQRVLPGESVFSNLNSLSEDTVRIVPKVIVPNPLGVSSEDKSVATTMNSFSHKILIRHCKREDGGITVLPCCIPICIDYVPDLLHYTTFNNDSWGVDGLLAVGSTTLHTASVYELRRTQRNSSGIQLEATYAGAFSIGEDSKCLGISIESFGDVYHLIALSGVPIKTKSLTNFASTGSFKTKLHCFQLSSKEKEAPCCTSVQISQEIVLQSTGNDNVIRDGETCVASPPKSLREKPCTPLSAQPPSLTDVMNQLLHFEARITATLSTLEDRLNQHQESILQIVDRLDLMGSRHGKVI